MSLEDLACGAADLLAERVEQVFPLDVPGALTCGFSLGTLEQVEHGAREIGRLSAAWHAAQGTFHGGLQRQHIDACAAEDLDESGIPFEPAREQMQRLHLEVPCLVCQGLCSYDEGTSLRRIPVEGQRRRLALGRHAPNRTECVPPVGHDIRAAGSCSTCLPACVPVKAIVQPPKAGEPDRVGRRVLGHCFGA